MLQWVAEHACATINRAAVGKDGKTPYRRTVGKNPDQKLVEFGEQVIAKVKRKKRSLRKQSLATKWIRGTWVGVTHRTNEYMIVEDGGKRMLRAR